MDYKYEILQMYINFIIANSYCFDNLFLMIHLQTPHNFHF